MDIYQPYTYLVGWSQQDLWYYGVRYAKQCRPDDLWKSYFTSSSLVKDTRLKYGEPDVVQVRKTFDNANEAKKWESKVLVRMNVLGNDRWLNRNISGEQFIIKQHAPETIIKMKQAWALKDADVKKQLSESISRRQLGCSNSFYGRKHSEESNEKRRLKLLGKPKSTSHKERHSGSNNHFYGKEHSESAKEKMKDAWVRRINYECPHCKKSTKNKTLAMRWHFDNCKLKS